MSGSAPILRRLVSLRFVLAMAFLGFQLFIVYQPLDVEVTRPVHIVLSLATIFLWSSGRASTRRVVDALLLAGTMAVLAYYLLELPRLSDRMENVDEVTWYDQVFGVLVLGLLMEAVRRVVGWSLLGVIVAFVAYGFLGPWFPGWLGFQGFEFGLFIEMMTMASHGILGLTTQTSVDFVWYFILFGVVYAATGGGQLFIDTALRLVGRSVGGAAKSSIVASSMFGTISGSAVSNVVATGVFTIPLMRRTGYAPAEAAAHEATASTGGQLMPPVMGVAAFVMAELLAEPYARIALAGIIPAVAFYFALYVAVDLKARRRGVGTLSGADLDHVAPIGPRVHLFASPLTLIGLLAAGYSAPMAALVASAVALITCAWRRSSRMTALSWIDMVEEVARQAAQVAIPIVAIGIIVAVAIQSNLALKFSTQLITLSGGTLIGAMLMVILGCLIMGMGLPTVAAYIIGAILFVPAMTKLGIDTLAAHFFVMYYCVLSMITPPVALASYAAAGLAKAPAMQAGWLAFRLSFVLFLIPFAFAFDPSLLWSGEPSRIALAFASMLAATHAWSVALEGYLGRVLGMGWRLAFAALALAVLFSSTGGVGWTMACGALALCHLVARRWPFLFRKASS